MSQMGDMKLKSPAMETLSHLAEAVGPNAVMHGLYKKAAAHKNPKAGVV
jgi:hypothetical protein